MLPRLQRQQRRRSSETNISNTIDHSRLGQQPRRPNSRPDCRWRDADDVDDDDDAGDDARTGANASRAMIAVVLVDAATVPDVVAEPTRPP